MSVANAQPRKPGALWRATSSFVMATTGMLCRSFLYGLNDVEVVGLDNFLKLLDARKDVEARQRGLITGELCYLAHVDISFVLLVFCPCR